MSTGRRFHVNETAVILLSLLGWPDDRIRRLLDERTLGFKPHLGRGLWERFGDGRDFDALGLENWLEGRWLAENSRANRRTSHLCLIENVRRRQTKWQAEMELGGQIASELWDKAVEYAATLSPRNDISRDIMPDIEDVDRQREEQRVIIWPWLTAGWMCQDGRVLTTHGSCSYTAPVDEIRRFLAASVKNGWRVNVSGATEEVMALIVELGLPTVGVPNNGEAAGHV